MKDLMHYWRTRPTIRDAVAGLHMNYAWQLGWGEPCPMPNDRGIFLLALWEVFVALPYQAIKQSRCKHPNMVDESYGGPDSGCMAGSCPDCGWSYHHTLY